MGNPHCHLSVTDFLAPSLPPMPLFTSHIFVCCNRREPTNSRGCCNPDGSEALRQCFKAEIKRRNLGPLVRANQSGCLDQCELGPTVVIYPQQIWYGGVRIEDVPRIIDETVIGGRVLDDLAIPVERLNAKTRSPA
jgi:(2Fe-2S) ferredoxin